jgi:hypothetical protein
VPLIETDGLANRAVEPAPAIFQKMVRAVGFEPTTSRFQAEDSAQTELHPEEISHTQTLAQMTQERLGMERPFSKDAQRSRIVKERSIGVALLYRRSRKFIGKLAQHGSGYARRTRSQSDRQRHSDATQNKKPGVLSKHPGFLGMNVGYTIISEILGRRGDGSSAQSAIKDS